MMRAMHGIVNAGTLDAWLAEVHKALKPKGILAIEQHRAKPDAKPLRERKERLSARGVGHRAGRGRGVQARWEVGDQRQPQGHQGLPRGRVDVAAHLRARGQGP